MRDREPNPNYILSNGAIRYGIYDSDGTLLRYEFIKLDDDPTVAGSIYNRANVLPDAVCDALGIPDTSEPRDAFLGLRTFALHRGRASTFERYMMGGML